MVDPALVPLLSRRGAARIALIPPDVLAALNRGAIPTVNLNEFLALDLPQLGREVAAHIGLDPRADRLEDAFAMLTAFPPVRRHDHVARALYDLAAARPDRDQLATALANHPSDIARNWAAAWVRYSGLDLPAKLHAVRRFAADPHFGVREMAWMAVRDDIEPHLEQALALLQPWVLDRDDNIRRFASELTRPRGVWCAQISRLNAEPWLGLPLLEPLRSDPSRYVQNSVANWLNDAAKTAPEWVDEVGRRWAAASATPATAYIVRRARRTLDKPQ